MNYEHLLNTYSGRIWKKIGIQRRAGVAVPLFSLYSSKSIGIGEIPDLKLLVDWCKLTGLSIIQLLPMNELGMDFSPYSSVSTFAIDPVYLRLTDLKLMNKNKFKEEITALREKFPAGHGEVNYDIKKEKLKLLAKICKDSDFGRSIKYKKFVRENEYWLNDYALYRLIKDEKDERAWFKWKKTYRDRDEKTLRKLTSQNKQKIEFYCWLQWQLYEQLTALKKYAAEKKVFLMGDIPFLVARDSADVWACQDYFKLDYEAGAPPDVFFAKGQRWGMPPYEWNNIARDGFRYIKHRLSYAASFYDMFRIDHFVGLLRVWIINKHSPKAKGAKDGRFDPELEYIWGEHGRKLLTVILEDTEMLPCAEDLGTVPPASYHILWKAGVPGVEVQRWSKNWSDGFDFIKPSDYRINSVATVSTHDSSTLPAWWKYEAGTIDRYPFRKFCKNKKLPVGKMRHRLFDKDHPGKDKFYWKTSVDSVEKLLSIVKLPESEAQDLIGMYRSSFGEKETFWKYIGFQGKMRPLPDTEFIKRSLETISRTSSVFSIQLLFEWLYLDKKILTKHSSAADRINFPGIVNNKNWRLVMPLSLEKLLRHPVNELIKDINSTNGRAVK
ncbi:MAG: 4-alpha-glucanotransferase [Ignavibacteriae bacterium]|nr:4-alpha-glucanotransferase [Ignavibacteriota bacterium]MCB9243819.1 4-alpha-glucanotransferase [Ignavibacteriales bacterium]